MTAKKRLKKRSGVFKVTLVLLGLLITFFIYQGVKLYFYVFAPNVMLGDKKEIVVYIQSGSTYLDIYSKFVSRDMLKNPSSFHWVARRKNYPNHIKAGRYIIKNRMNNNTLVNLLRSGQQEPVNVTFHNIRTKEDLASDISKHLEADSLSIINLLNNKEFLTENGFSEQTVLSLFIPNTYEFFWNTSANDFFFRMKKEYEKFWNKNRQSLAEGIHLTPIEVSTLASIVDEETYITEEKPRVAGVYINRLKKGIRLQADPTVKFAVGNIKMQRVLKKHLRIDSPYNTYRHAGIPPGPIRIPSVEAIDAVLQHEKHDYLYFCAKEDFSGYHRFARTLAQHNQNARLYQRELNRRRILR